MVHNHNILIYFDDAVVNLAHTDTTYIFVVIDGADQYLGAGFRVTCGSGNVLQDGLKQRSHVFVFDGQVQGGGTVFGRSKYERTIQLFVIGIQIQEQFQYFVYHSFGSGFGTVNFVDTYDNGKIQLQGLLQNEFCLRHGAFKSVYYQDDAIYHLKHTFHFAAKVSVTGSVDDVDFCVFIHNGSVFGKDRDTSFTLNSVAVHDTLGYFLILSEYTALF